MSETTQACACTTVIQKLSLGDFVNDEPTFSRLDPPGWWVQAQGKKGDLNV
jgi:hypothetical protein